MNLRKLHVVTLRYFMLLFIIMTTPLTNSYARSGRNSAKSKFVIILLDETDSFGQNSTRGIAKSLYWDDALAMTKRIVQNLNPGDELLVLAIDEQGFEEEDILVPFHQFDRAFLKAKMEKKKLARQILLLKRRKDKYSRTDILGALYQAAHFARREAEHETVLFCFSDMKQEPKWPTMSEAAELSFPAATCGYFFFVDASGRQSWEQLIKIWKPIFEHAGLNAADGNSFNFFQYGESALRIKRILSEW